MKAIHTFEPGELRDQLITVFMGFQALLYYGHQIPPIDVKNHIEKILADMGMLKASRRSNLVKSMVKPEGLMTTRVGNNYLGLICKLHPVRSNIVNVPWDYETCLFFRLPNQELTKEQQIY